MTVLSDNHSWNRVIFWPAKDMSRIDKVATGLVAGRVRADDEKGSVCK